jgi:hypothetical protein
VASFSLCCGMKLGIPFLPRHVRLRHPQSPDGARVTSQASACCPLQSPPGTRVTSQALACCPPTRRDGIPLTPSRPFAAGFPPAALSLLRVLLVLLPSSFRFSYRLTLERMMGHYVEGEEPVKLNLYRRDG